MYTIVLPTNPGNISNTTRFDNFIRLNMKLYSSFLNSNEIHKFIIITPSIWIEKFKNITKSFDFNFVIKSDDDYFDTDSISMNRGWIKQQVLKLAASKDVETEHYIPIDDDLYLTQPLCYKDLFYQNKIIYSHEGWSDDGPNFATNTNWWKSSCRMLNYDINNIILSKHNMSVTPQVLLTSEVDNLKTEIEKNNQDNWQNQFVKFGATEFASYWINIKKQNKEDMYTVHGKKMWTMNHNFNVLNAGMTRDDILSKIHTAFSLKEDYFFVIQSWINYPQEWYSDYIETKICQK